MPPLLLAAVATVVVAGVVVVARAVRARRGREPSWWPEFECEFRAYVGEREPHG